MLITSGSHHIISLNQSINIFDYPAKHLDQFHLP